MTRAPVTRSPRGLLDTVSFGDIFLEVVFGHTRRLPLPGEEIFVDSFAFSCGGVVTSAVASNRAGARSGMATVLGDDLGSRLAERLCVAQGVDLSVSDRSEGQVAGVTAVLNYDGDRAFVTHMPPRDEWLRAEHRRWCDVLTQVRPTWAYLHAHPDVLDVLEAARAVGTRVALDVNLEDVVEFPDAVARCARLAQVFLPNEEELRRVTGCETMSEALSVAGSWCPWVVAKRGPMGAVLAEGGRTTEVTGGLKDVEVKDLTGAGDAFAGALIGALALGTALGEAICVANTAGSDAAGRLGAAGAMDLKPDLVPSVLGQYATPGERGQAVAARRRARTP